MNKREESLLQVHSELLKEISIEKLLKIPSG